MSSDRLTDVSQMMNVYNMNWHISAFQITLSRLSCCWRLLFCACASIVSEADSAKLCRFCHKVGNLAVQNNGFIFILFSCCRVKCQNPGRKKVNTDVQWALRDGDVMWADSFQILEHHEVPAKNAALVGHLSVDGKIKSTEFIFFLTAT